MAASDVDFVLVESRALLREVFPLVEEGVEAITARCPDEVVCAGDVYAAVLCGECQMRLVRVEGRVVGFLTTAALNRLGGERTLMVWMLYVEPGTADVIPEVVAELDFMARDEGCVAIEFGTTRTAWERRLARHGYRPKVMVFRKEVA